MEIAASNSLDLVAVERPSGGELVAPSVVHWKENHYAAIVEQKGDTFRVVDPTFRLSRWLSADAINHEASGQFLVPAKQKPATWRTLTPTECANIFGKGFPGGGWDPPWGPPCTGCSCADGSDGTGPASGGPGPNGIHSNIAMDAAGGTQGPNGIHNNVCSECGVGGQTGAGGMPQWLVTEPNIMLWIVDEPLAYQTATGGRMSFKTYYNAYYDIFNSGDEQFGGNYPIGGTSFDNNWGASWISYIDTGVPSGGEVTLYPPGGGSRVYTNFDGTGLEYYTNTRLIGITNAGSLIGFNLLYPSGAKDVYGYIDGGSVFFLSQQIDAHGRATTYVYNTTNTITTLQYVIDCDGRTNTFSYTLNPMGVGNVLVSKITDPFGRSATFSYYTNNDLGNSLSNVVDAVGNSTTFTYADPYCLIMSNMTTPYGKTSFGFGSVQTTNGTYSNDIYYVSCHVTEPDNGQHLFLYVQGEDFSGVPKVYTDTSNVPTNRPTATLDNPDWTSSAANDYMNYANSFYWNRAQYTNLSTNFLNNTNFDALTATDYADGRLRHWNQDDEGNMQGFSLSMERLPSPDGVTAGKMTWWDYPGKVPEYFNWQGTNAFPSLVIRVQPDGSEWYQMYQTDQWGIAPTSSALIPPTGWRCCAPTGTSIRPITWICCRPSGRTA